LPKRLVGFRSGPGLPLQAVVVASVARPRVEGVHDALELARKLRHGSQQDSLQRRYRLLVAIWRALLHHDWTRAVVIHPIEAELRVERGAEAGCEESIAVQPARGVQNKDDKLSLGNGEAVRPG